MNRKEFINKLRKEISKLPEEEIEAAIEYYEEYFDDAGEENEKEVLDQLGSPKKVAGQIKSEYVVRTFDEEEKPTAKKRISVIWYIIIGICSAPVSIPLAILAGAIAIALVIAAVCCIVAVFAMIIGGILAAIGSIIVGIMAIPVALSTASFFVGIGIGVLAFMCAMGCLLIIGIKAGIKGIVKAVRKRYKKKEMRTWQI